MSKLRNLHRQIEWFARRGGTSYAWIALLRMIEARARSSGASFSAVRAAIEARVELGARPELPAIVRAAALLAEEHAALQATRGAMIAARRAEKRGGRRRPDVAAPLDAMEARVAENAAGFPRVGCWGWRRAR